MTITLPEITPDMLHVAPDAVADEIRMLAAVKLFELGRMSSGLAAELAGVPKPVFLQRLGEYGVSVFDITEEELRAEAKAFE
jgi:predicted HTH domain antitoxin